MTMFRPRQPQSQPQQGAASEVRYPQSNGVVFSPVLRQKLLAYGLRLDPEVQISRNLKYNGPVALMRNTLAAHISIDAYSYISHDSLFVLGSIGRYTSIAHYVECGLGIHDIHCATMTNAVCHSSSFIFHTGPINRITAVERERGEIVNNATIGNDVWIGADVLILGDVKIGDGAVIGAGSVITQDVPPYAIVAGAGGGRNSERIIKGYRFTDEQISDLLELQWWQYDVPKFLAAGHKLPLDDIKGFISFMRHEAPEVLPKIPLNWRLLIPENAEKAQLAPISPDYEIGPFIPDSLRFNPDVSF